MAASSVDISAIIPALQEAIKPLTEVLAVVDGTPPSARPSDATLLRKYAPAVGLTLGDVRKLTQAVQAIYNVAGVK